MTTVEYLLNSLNRVAGLESRRKVDSSEWVLCWQVFCNLCHIFGTPTVYLFTSRVSQQVAQHVEWKPDPSSIANVNTMDTGSWLRIYPILSVPSLTKQNTTRPSTHSNTDNNLLGKKVVVSTSVGNANNETTS